MILRLSQNKKLFITKQTHTDFEKSKNEHFNLYNHLRNEFKGKNEYGSSLNYLNNINKKIENLSNYLELNVFQNMELIDNVSEEFKRTHFYIQFNQINKDNIEVSNDEIDNLMLATGLNMTTNTTLITKNSGILIQGPFTRGHDTSQTPTILYSNDNTTFKKSRFSFFRQYK